METQYKIAASITAYEDPEAVEDCLLALQQQSIDISAILIVDNSSQAIVLPSDSENRNIVLHKCPENIGTAGALEVQINWAIRENFDFIWTFDQDSKPEATGLECLLNCYEKAQKEDSRIGIIAPLVIDPTTCYKLHGLAFKGYKLSSVHSQVAEQPFYTCDVVISSGSLININAARSVEIPDINLFIDAVDWAYCLNFRQKEFEIVVATHSLMEHKYASCFQVTFPFRDKKLLIHNYSPLRRYYMCRNHTYIMNEYSKDTSRLEVCSYRIFELFKAIAKILLYEPEDKSIKIWACIRGTVDGFRGNLENRWIQ